MRPPTTPPSTVKTTQKIREVPRFSLPDESNTFQTPRQRNSNRKAPLVTPTSSKSAMHELQTPASSKNSLFDTPNHTQMSPETPFTVPSGFSKNSGILTSNSHSSTNIHTKTPAASQLTPEYTPAKSPRHPKRKRLHLDEFFQSSTDSIASLLLPNHSIVGSGRKAVKNNTHTTLRAPISLDFSELSKLNENLAFEEDFDVQRKLDFGPKTPEPSSQQTFTQNLQSGKSMYLPLQEPQNRLEILKEPGTPPKQLLSDAQVAQWYGKSYRGQFSDDEDSDHEQKTVVLENPFHQASGPKSVSKPRPFSHGNPFNSKSSINYDTHLELLNHRTGERRVELLTESQRKHKPRKLDFSNI